MSWSGMSVEGRILGNGISTAESPLFGAGLTKYNIHGQSTPLPSLKQKGRFHACGKFTDSNGGKEREA